mmetsp:Transcript_16536/g.19060  ORF Transcript_16536/g.19060 Transcript_16536/m.19060 type:complete len:104 (-) Transcript_16536:99-410(-)
MPGSEATKLLMVYRRLLRLAAVYPSRNRMGIYDSIRVEFRENAKMDPSQDETKTKVSLALQGLTQLGQFEEKKMSKESSANWSVTMEKNPMPQPDKEKGSKIR